MKKNWYYYPKPDVVACLPFDSLSEDQDAGLLVELGPAITGKKAEGAELLSAYKAKFDLRKYENCKPIQPGHSSVWLVTFCEFEQMLCAFHAEATVDDIVDFIKLHYPERKSFTVRRVDVGIFVLAAVRQVWMSGDGREVNQDMEVK